MSTLTAFQPQPSVPAARVVLTQFYDVVSPPANSGIRLSGVAARALRVWPPEAQRALHAAVAAGTLPLIRLPGGAEGGRLDNGQFIVITRRAGGTTIQAIFNRLRMED